MFTWSVRQRWMYGATRSVGLGFIAGAVEAVGLALSIKLPLSAPEFVLMAVADIFVMGVVAFFAALATGAIHLVARSMNPSRAIAWQMGLAGFLLVAFFLWQIALGVWLEQSRLVAAVAVGLMPFGFAVVVFYNCLYWLKKVEIGVEYRASLPVWALGAGVLACTVAGVAYQYRDTGGAGALEGDRNVLLITIDTLRRDYISIYGEPQAAPTPRIDALAREGMLFTDAVTPMPETAPAHASMLTGRHPLRHGVLSNGHELAGGYRTVAEILEAEGYATGAFVSSFAVGSRVGLDQGFRVYDDDLSPFPGVAQINVVKWLLRVWMVLGDPAATPWLLERGGAQTNARYFDWLDRHDDVPFFAWVHYFEPHAPYEAWGVEGFESNGTPDAPAVDHRSAMDLGESKTWTDAEREILINMYREEVAYSDALVGNVLDDLEARGLAEDTLVIVTADHGEMLGEHGLDFLHHGIYDEVIRIPLVIRAPDAYISNRVVDAQVRLMDLPNTILEYLKLDELEESEGVELLGYGQGVRSKTMWTSLVGRRSRSFSEGALIGMRNNGVKYIRDVVSGEELLFDLGDDPLEQHDLSGEHLGTLETARRMIDPEQRAFLEHIEVDPGDVGLSEEMMLEALGYTE